VYTRKPPREFFSMCRAHQLCIARRAAFRPEWASDAVLAISIASCGSCGPPILGSGATGPHREMGGEVVDLRGPDQRGDADLELDAGVGDEQRGELGAPAALRTLSGIWPDSGRTSEFRTMPRHADTATRSCADQARTRAA